MIDHKIHQLIRGMSFSALGLESVLPICRDRRYSRAARGKL